MSCLPDVNVWLALVVDSHPHHQAAKRWLMAVNTPRILLCRITELGLFRLLTNGRVMDGSALTAAEAWKVRDTILLDPRITFLNEPAGFDGPWRQTALAGKIGPNFWTDAYLVSLCAAANCALVTFDRALASRREATVELLTGPWPPLAPAPPIRR